MPHRLPCGTEPQVYRIDISRSACKITADCAMLKIPKHPNLAELAFAIPSSWSGTAWCNLSKAKNQLPSLKKTTIWLRQEQFRNTCRLLERSEGRLFLDEKAT